MVAAATGGPVGWGFLIGSLTLGSASIYKKFKDTEVKEEDQKVLETLKNSNSKEEIEEI